MNRLANPSKAHRVQMRIFGTLCAVGGISLLAIYWSNSKAYEHGKADLYIAGYGIPLLFLGLGLLAAKIWAEIVLDLCHTVLVAATIAALVMNKPQDSEWSISLVLLAFLLAPVALSIYRLETRSDSPSVEHNVHTELWTSFASHDSQLWSGTRD